MRILLIGKNSLQNDAIQKLLSVPQGWNIEQITPSNLEHQTVTTKGQFALSLLDLSSCLDRCKEVITKIHRMKVSAKLAVIFDSHSEELLNSLRNYGVDEYLSIEWEPDKFIRTISKLGNSE